MSAGFPLNSYSWRAVELGGRPISAETGERASALNPKSLKLFELYPKTKAAPTRVVMEFEVKPGSLELGLDGLVRLCRPHLIDEIKLVRRRTVILGSGSVRELWFLGMETDGLPTAWIHVRPGLTRVTLEAPKA